MKIILPESLRIVLEERLAKKRELPERVAITPSYKRLVNEMRLVNGPHLYAGDHVVHFELEFLPDSEFDEKHMIIEKALQAEEDRKELAELRNFKKKVMEARDLFKD